MNRKEQIKKVEEIIAYGCSDELHKALIKDFPELAESEDERIRKELLSYARLKVENMSRLSLQKQVDKDNYQWWKDVVAWLEKQKEQKDYKILQWREPNDCVDIPEGHYIVIAYSPGVVGLGYISDGRVVSAPGKKPQAILYIPNMGELYRVEAQQPVAHENDFVNKEQKPVEWDDYTETNLDRALMIIKKAKGNLQGYQSDDGIYECDMAIECIEHILYRGINMDGLCKPVEWSDEDEKMIANLRSTLANLSVRGLIKKETERKYSAWLKSLRPKVSVNWSEEDERLYRDALIGLKYAYEDLSSHKSSDFAKKTEDAYNWLQSLRPQPKVEWSEEDEEIFNNIIEKAKGGHWIEVNEITWLINRFKSLRPQPKQEIPADTEVLLAKLVNLLKKYRIGEETAKDLANRIADSYGVQRYLDGLCDETKPHWKPSLSTADLENNLGDIQDNYYDCSHEYKVLGEAIEFIRSTNSHWKPSEEQMKALLSKLPVVKGSGDKVQYLLESLYDDLKKL